MMPPVAHLFECVSMHEQSTEVRPEFPEHNRTYDASGNQLVALHHADFEQIVDHLFANEYHQQLNGQLC